MNDWSYEEFYLEDFEDNPYLYLDVCDTQVEKDNTCPRCRGGCDYCLMLVR